MTVIPIVRSGVQLVPDPSRIIVKPYLPAEHDHHEGKSRVEQALDRIMALSPGAVDEAVARLRDAFEHRHPEFDEVLQRGFASVAHLLPEPAGLGSDVRQLIGAYFLHEYSLEGAALTNPSMVPAPDQSGTPAGSLRVIVSLRAVGEGHISSIEFRTGLVGPDGEITIDAPRAPIAGSRRIPIFEKVIFAAKLEELGADATLVNQALDGLSDFFTMMDLEAALAALEDQSGSSHAVQHVTQVMHWLASSNYELAFPDASHVSQRVLFPNGPAESHGMEDARLVLFTEDDGSVRYYATYTAFDGFSVLPQLVETTDFCTFRMATLNGYAARNKGIALFPRRVSGQFAALARSDGESNYLMMSDHIRFWHDAQRVQLPTRPWELMQIGNSGSPIETEAGWLVLTHGVGPMRTYALGALLLDVDDPSHVIGHLAEPLLTPLDSERDGYVPNVVYSCGSLVHNGRLVIPYGASDTTTGFAHLSLDTLLEALTAP